MTIAPQSAKNEKVSFLEKFHANAKNSADMTDTIVVPRTIFKGYLAFMAGTALGSLGALLSKPRILSKALSISSVLVSLYGTYAFVRPFVIKDAPGVDKTK